MRSFLAFPVPSAVADYAKAVQTYLRQAFQVRGRWTRRNAMHVTAVSLDEQPEDVVGPLCESLTSLLASSPPIFLTLTGVATFGYPPRVLTLS